MVLGVLVRAFHVLSDGFPLNDGGLFYQMTLDLQANDYKLPAFTTYNADSIPFSYPPLGFWLAGLLDEATPLSLTDVFRFLPLLATCLTIPAFALLARSMLGRKAAIAAVFAFALMPRSFIWLVMGGGVTRSLGLLFALLALYCVYRLYRDRQPKLLLPATVLAALTVLSHLETGWFLAFSTGFLFLRFARDPFGLRVSAALALGTLVLTAPWWLTVIGEHGLSPFTAAQATGGSIFADGETRLAVLRSLLSFVATSEPLFPVLGALAVLGGVVAVGERRGYLVVWVALIIVLDWRAHPTFTTVPLALLAGLGILAVLRRLAEAAPLTLPSSFDHARELLRSRRTAPVVAVLAFFVLYATIGAMTRVPGLNGEGMLLTGLREEERQAMAWVSRTTPVSSRFLIIPEGSWETARASEWFPVLARRTSVATVQGTEWLPSDGFEARVEAHELAQDCGYRTTECLDRFPVETGLDFDYVYIVRNGDYRCCSTLAESLAADSRYELVYYSSGAEIFGRRLPGDAPTLHAR